MRAISDIGDPRLVKALAHPLRVQILTTLEDRVASPSDLAAEGVSEVSQAIARLHEEVAGIHERSSARLEKAGEEAAVQAGLVTMLFEAASGDASGEPGASSNSNTPGRKRN